MLNRVFRKGLRNRAIIAMALLGASYSLNTSSLERLWAELIACSTSEATYVALGRSGNLHGVRFDLQEKAFVHLSSGKVRTFSVARIARECTYIGLVAIVLPFMVRTLSLRGLLTGTILTLVIVGTLNFLRLELDLFLFRTGSSLLWSHDIPHYSCYTLSILGALWYYYRSTVPRDAGNNTEAAAADGSSAMTANA